MNTNNRILASGCLTSAISATFFLVLPLAIGAIGNGTEYGEQFLGLIATTYLIAFTIAGVFSAAIPANTNQRYLSFSGFVLLIFGFFLAAISMNNEARLLTGFAAAGIGAGILYSVSFRIIGLAQNIERAFGLKLFTEQIVAAALFFTFSYLSLSYSPLMKALSAVALLFMVVITFTPKNAAIEESTETNIAPHTSKPTFVMSIFAVIVFMLAMTGPWTFLEPLSVERRIDSQLFGTLGAISLLLGGVGGAIAAVQAAKLGLNKPLIWSVIITIIIYGVLIALGSPGFIIFVLAFPMLWNYALAYQFSATTHLDRHNQYSGWLAPAVAIGASVGPLLAGTILENRDGFLTMLIVTGLLSAIGLLLTVQSLRSNAR